MEAFKKVVENLGDIYPNKEYKVQFPYEEGVKILKIVTHCGCSNAFDKPSERYVQVTYTPGDVPDHMVMAGNLKYDAVKHMEVVYEWPEQLHGTSEERTLKIKAVVHKKLK